MSSALRYAERDLAVVKEVLTLVKGRTAVVQAGANLGVFPEFLSKEFGAVYSFEPDPELMWRATARCAGRLNVHFFCAALGRDRGLVRPVRARRDGDLKREAHEGVTHVVPGGSVPTLRVDDLGLEVLDLLYLDLEGYEALALVGACETLERCHPVVVCEMNGSGKPLGFTDEDIRTHLRVADYDLLRRIGSDEVFVPRYHR